MFLIFRNQIENSLISLTLIMKIEVYSNYILFRKHNLIGLVNLIYNKFRKHILG
jgi:hypothetical protein